MTPLQLYYEYHLPKVVRCENCGRPINDVGHKNIAHILPKSQFKSVSTNIDNSLYLCTSLDGPVKGCHEIYDTGFETAKRMTVWSIAKERFNKFKHLITEKSITLLTFEN